ncbi:site-specific integrase [Vibrio owensii]|uniref:tyrosine-type recombinase/integrase n=1 Tax=Vibrio owensii TaxID=696485 RepID=UPI0010472988|nr:site-specific integrase [Vibrio owensii]TDE19261.1 site-specific integrase [Vibrio owensii]
MAKAKSLTSRQLNRVLQRCLLLPNSELKRAAFVLSFSTLRVSELSQITIQDLLLPTGEIKTELPLRAALCKRKKPRTIWLSSQTKSILQEWLSYRLVRRWGLSNSNEYQGLIPNSKVLYCSRGRPYALKAKRRTSKAGEIVTYWACDSLESMFREVFKLCGVKGASSHSGRRSYATNMNAKGVRLEIIARALGHEDEQVTLDYIDVSDTQLAKASELAF